VTIDTPQLTEWILELVRRTAVDLPEDVERALRAAREIEKEGSPARQALGTILENVRLARERSTPICQDTGTNIFWIRHPEGTSTRRIAEAIRGAVREATARQYLRPNAVDSLTGRNSGDGVLDGLPAMHFEEWDRDELEIRLMLKGGGCENVGAQYSLPDSELGAGRDLRGVEKVILDAVFRAQGKGCAPGIVGVAIGGDRGSSYAVSKEQLLRRLDDENPIPELRELEARVVEKANRLGIGPMGFGGRTTLLGAKIAAIARIPASFFVSVSYMCWACRRRTMRIRDGRMEIDPD
jgi:fumarate hydratase class I